MKRLIKAGADVNVKLENSSRFATALEASQADWSEDEFLFYRLLYRVARAAGVKSLFIQRRKEQKPEIVNGEVEEGYKKVVRGLSAMKCHTSQI